LTNEAESNKTNVESLQKKMTKLEEELDAAEKLAKDATEKYVVKWS
jgi:hypothetical protein